MDKDKVPLMEEATIIEELEKQDLLRRIPSGAGLNLLNDDVSILNRSTKDIFVYLVVEKSETPS